MKKVDIIIAPKAYQGCAFVPRKGLMLVDQPENPGFKCWTKGNTKIWEFGKTRTEVIIAMARRAKAEKFEIGKIIHSEKPTL